MVNLYKGFFKKKITFTISFIIYTVTFTFIFTFTITLTFTITFTLTFTITFTITFTFTITISQDPNNPSMYRIISPLLGTRETGELERTAKLSKFNISVVK